MTQKQELAHDEKLIVQVQVCTRCGRTFPFKRGRKNCPYCKETLKARATVLKTPKKPTIF